MVLLSIKMKLSGILRKRFDFAYMPLYLCTYNFLLAIRVFEFDNS